MTEHHISYSGSTRKFLDRALERADGLTSSDESIVNYYRLNLPDAAFAGIGEVSETSGVSTASVTRFVRKLGYPNFKLFTAELNEALAQDLKKPVNRVGELEPSSTALGKFLSPVQKLLGEQDELAEAETLDQIANILADDRRPLYLAALSSGRPLIEYFGSLLSYLRGNFVMLGPTDMWAHQLAGLTKESLVFIAMINRTPAPHLALAQRAKETGATIVVLSNHERWRSDIEADYWLKIATPSGDTGRVFTSRMPLLFIFEALLELVAQKMQGHNKQRLQDIEDVFMLLQSHRD